MILVKNLLKSQPFIKTVQEFLASIILVLISPNIFALRYSDCETVEHIF